MSLWVVWMSFLFLVFGWGIDLTVIVVGAGVWE